MENPTQLQLLQALVFFSAGIAVGVVYDVCRAVRRCSSRTVQAAADVLFVCIGASVLFVLGMLVGEGQLRIFMLGCTVLGALAYSNACSSTVVPFLCKGIRGLKRLAALAKIPLKRAKNFIKSIKNLFPKRCVWVKMNGYSFNMRQSGLKRTRKGEEAENSHEADRMDGLHRTGCNDGIRRVEYYSSSLAPDQGGGVSRGADRTGGGAVTGK